MVVPTSYVMSRVAANRNSLILGERDDIELVKWYLENRADPNAQVGGGIHGVTNFHVRFCRLFITIML